MMMGRLREIASRMYTVKNSPQFSPLLRSTFTHPPSIPILKASQDLKTITSMKVSLIAFNGDTTT